MPNDAGGPVQDGEAGIINPLQSWSPSQSVRSDVIGHSWLDWPSKKGKKGGMIKLHFLGRMNWKKHLKGLKIMERVNPSTKSKCQAIGEKNICLMKHPFLFWSEEAEANLIITFLVPHETCKENGKTMQAVHACSGRRPSCAVSFQAQWRRHDWPQSRKAGASATTTAPLVPAIHTTANDFVRREEQRVGYPLEWKSSLLHGYFWVKEERIYKVVSVYKRCKRWAQKASFTILQLFLDSKF